jgi:hypothetical protein
MMSAKVKRWIGHCIIKVGQHSVGKSLVNGLYDPKIPEELKAEARKGERRR